MPDFFNKQAKNMVLHNIDGSIVDGDDLPVRRGLPRVGKVCECVVSGGGMTAGVSYKCTSVTPFPTRNGGGTWVPWGEGGGGGTSGDLSGFAIAQSSTVFDTSTDTPNYARYSVVGGRAFIEVELVTTGNGVASNPLIVLAQGPTSIVPRNAPFPGSPQSLVSTGAFEIRIGGIAYASSGSLLITGAVGGGYGGLFIGLVDPDAHGDPGATGAYTAAIGDTIRLSANWEVA
jgi:hypothetical protein